MPHGHTFKLSTNMPTSVEIEAILCDPATSGWLKRCLEEALTRDPVDAANDAELLAEVLASHCDKLQQASR